VGQQLLSKLGLITLSKVSDNAELTLSKVSDNAELWTGFQYDGTEDPWELHGARGMTE
jgi:hypothetical protein